MAIPFFPLSWTDLAVLCVHTGGGQLTMYAGDGDWGRASVYTILDALCNTCCHARAEVWGLNVHYVIFFLPLEVS